VISLKTVVGQYPHTAPLRDGRVTSPQVHLEHISVSPVNRAFRPMVNALVYDLSEMALATLMLAHAMNRPLRALPVVLMRQSAHASLVVRGDSPLQSAHQLIGRTIGVRAYTQTTGTWLRGILQEQFGLDLSSLSWVTVEPAHVDGFQEPANCRRAREGATLLQMLVDGDLDAAVGLEPHPLLRPLLPATAEHDWLEQTGVAPINHVLVVKDELVGREPWLTSELFLMFSTARERSIREDQAQPGEYGLEANRKAIERLAHYAHQQGIIPTAYTASQLFEPF
jgi:4,5-dihydroxyphthalate decarboxylase